MSATKTTTAQRSATAKAAAAQRKADKAAGIPSIAALTAQVHEVGGISKAAARREAVAMIQRMRREHADNTAFAAMVAETVAIEAAPSAHAQAVDALAAELHADKPWRSMDEARDEAERRLEDAEGVDAAALVASAKVSYWHSLKAMAASLSRR